MKIDNRTPFVPFSFASESLGGTPLQVVIVKGTFAIEAGAQLRPAHRQEPLRTQDERWEQGASSSLRHEDDLAPFKPFADVVINGTAYAPGGKPLPQWHAGVRVGSLEKRVIVTGPRAWVHTPLLGWSLSPIVPIRSVPLRYEHAFGGDGHEQNPVGVGCVNLRHVDRSRPVAAPQILTADGRAPVFGQPYAVEGLAAIARAWQPRRARAGTFDEAWAAQEGRRLPANFDPTFFNAAHPDLIADDFLRGDEEVHLENLHQEHASVGFRLPGLTVAAGIVDRTGFRYGSIVRLDTLWIDADRMRAELTWRATLPLYKDGVACVDIGMCEQLHSTLTRAVVAQGGST